MCRIFLCSYDSDYEGEYFDIGVDMEGEPEDVQNAFEEFLQAMNNQK